MHDVFVSYASRDHVFVDRLTARLKAEQTRFWRDIFDTDYSELQAQITEAVRNCVIFLFVISPDSLRSQWCQQELSLARSYGKRIICVMRRMPDPTQLEKEWEAAPQKVEWLENCAFVLNQTWVNFRKKTDPAYEVDYDPVTRKVRNPQADGVDSDEANFEEGAGDLLHKMTIIPEDEKWRRKWELDARDWTNATDAKIKSSLLLRGDELKNAEGWLTRARVLSPEIGPFIAASQKERTRVKRRNRTIGGVFGVVLVGLVVLGIAVLITRQFYAINRALFLQSNAVTLFDKLNYADAQAFAEQSLIELDSAPLPYWFSEMMGIGTNRWDWYRQLGSICAMQGDAQCAEANYTRARELAPADLSDVFTDNVALGLVYLIQDPPNTDAAEDAFTQARQSVADQIGFNPFITEYLIARAYLRADFDRGDYAAVIARYDAEATPTDYLHDNLMDQVRRAWDTETPLYGRGFYSPYQLDVWYMLAVSYEETLSSSQIEAHTCDLWTQYIQLSLEYVPLQRTYGEIERLDDATDRIAESSCFKSGF